MIGELDGLMLENIQEEDKQGELLEKIGDLNKHLREKNEEIAQIKGTYGTLSSHNQVLRTQNEELERRLTQETNMKLKQGQDIIRLKE